MQQMETEKCIGCEKQFEAELISHDSGEPMCEKCEDEFAKEVKKCGIEALDEYLSERGLKNDFNIFCAAKFSDLTEEEIVDLDENADGEYKRWNLQDLSIPPSHKPHHPDNT